ncbi:hypothetical protein EDF59_10155 [Novosphingobium sp. ST904]|nr:hypothetical protein EDF59_10155 [Novosphingobium sp. ST904]
MIVVTLGPIPDLTFHVNLATLLSDPIYELKRSPIKTPPQGESPSQMKVF